MHYTTAWEYKFKRNVNQTFQSFSNLVPQPGFTKNTTKPPPPAPRSFPPIAPEFTASSKIVSISGVETLSESLHLYYQHSCKSAPKSSIGTVLLWRIFMGSSTISPICFSSPSQFLKFLILSFAMSDANLVKPVKKKHQMTLKFLQTALDQSNWRHLKSIIRITLLIEDKHDFHIPYMN